MNGTTDSREPLPTVATLERTLIELDAATKHAVSEIERLERDRDAAQALAVGAVAALPGLQKRIARGRGAQEQAVRERADLERRYADLLEAESIARSRYEQAEQRVEAFRAVEVFAKAARGAAEAGGDRNRAERERDAEERASREREEAETRVADLRAIATSVTAQRADVEHHVFAERAVESDVSSDRLAAERERESGEAAIDRAERKVASILAETAAVREHLASLDAEKVRVRDRLTLARERAVGEASSRIEYLRGAEERKRLERMEAERIVAGMRADEEALAQERAALERGERERVERRRVLERREAYDRALDERLEKKRRESEALVVPDPAPDEPGEPAAPAAPVAPFRPAIVAPSRMLNEPESRPAEGGGFFGRFGRRKRDHDPDEPSIDVASRIARDFGLLGEPAAPAPAPERPEPPPNAAP